MPQKITLMLSRRASAESKHASPSGSNPERNIACAPDLWLSGVAVAIGLGAAVYEKSWQFGFLAGLGTALFLPVFYAGPAWLFGWPQVRWVDAIDGVLGLLDLVGTILSLLS